MKPYTIKTERANNGVNVTVRLKWWYVEWLYARALVTALLRRMVR